MEKIISKNILEGSKYFFPATKIFLKNSIGSSGDTG